MVSNLNQRKKLKYNFYFITSTAFPTNHSKSYLYHSTLSLWKFPLNLRPVTSTNHVNLFEHNFPFLIISISDEKDILKFFMTFKIVLYMPIFRAVEIWSPNNPPLTMTLLLLGVAIRIRVSGSCLVNSWVSDCMGQH